MQTRQYRLRRALRIIRQSIRKGTDDWIVDNYDLIDREYRAARRHAGEIRRTRADLLASDYLREVGRVLTEERLIAFLRERSERQPLSYPLPVCLPHALAAAAILSVAEVCEGKRSDTQLPELITLLRTLPEPDMEQILSAVWEPEALLEAHEEDYPLYAVSTKHAYRRRIAVMADRKHCTESELLRELIRRSEENHCPIGRLLFPKRGVNACALWVWWSCFVLLFGGLSAVCAASFGWLWLLTALPLAEGVCPICDRVASFFCKQPPIFRLSSEQIPEKGKTVVAITTLFTEDGTDLERLERFYLSNKDPNLSFCLLADFKQASSKVTPADAETLRALQTGIDKLNKTHGKHFFLLWRDRVELEKGIYGGRERKRGAVGTLICRLCGEEVGHVHGVLPQNVRYLLTLDADTELFPGSVRELVGIALHPLNREYGVFQPVIRTELASSYRTYFTRLVSGFAGSSFYEHACFERNQSLYGEGIFCGKGLLDIRAFHKRALSLPSGRILSHDLPEGGLLGTLLLTDLPLSDSVPKNPASFGRRAHRWIRGDVQNLYFLFHREYALSFVAKKQIVCNLLLHLTPVFSLLSLLFGALLLRSETPALLLVLAANAHLLLPFLLSVTVSLLHGKPFLHRHAFTAALSSLALALLRPGYELCAVASDACLNADAMLRSLYRMLFSHKRLLEWTTAFAGESGSEGIPVYLKNGLPGATCGCLLFLLGHASVFRLAGILFFIHPILSYLLSLPLTRGTARVYVKPSEKNALLLKRHAADQWRFFADTVTAQTHFLPPDNLQLSPKRELAYRTSPTNIGLFLLSVLAALDLHLIDAKEAADRLERTLASVEGLPKYRGNLYNWYDLHTLAVLGDGFVSFVDSGNFAVCLLVLAQGLSEQKEREERFFALAMQAKRLLEETDLACFYNKRKQLFSLGWNQKTQQYEQGCYDLLMSEARTAGYYAVAAGLVPNRHWSALGRTVNAFQGYVGMVSWSGTMFEYFMPQLFLPIYRNSFLQETLLFAVWAQRKAAKGKPWGVSESCYHAFDGELHYRYHANGIRTLALRRDVRGETVISPYSTYLALAVCPSAAVRNLQALEACGMYGPYGMYEAFDRTPGRSRDGIAVFSYMAHHMGMSLLAIDNCINENVFVDRFLSDARMRSAVCFLQEKLPSDVAVLTDRLRYTPKKRSVRAVDPICRTESGKSDPHAPKAALLCRNGFSAIISSLGHVRLQKGELLLNDCRTERFSGAHTLLCGFAGKGRLDGCTPFFGPGDYTWETNDSGVCLIASGGCFSGRVRLSFCKNADCFRVEAEASDREERSVLFAFEPVLATERSYDAHQAFSKLFLQSAYEKESRILYFTRRERESGSPCVWLAVALQEEQTEFTFCTSKDGFPPESLNTPQAFDRPLDKQTGSCIDPLCVIRTAPVRGGRATLLLAMGETKKQVQSAVLIARRDRGAFRSGSDPETDRVLGELLFPRQPAPELWSEFRREFLWKHGISGDFPLWGASLRESDRERAERLLKSFARLTEAGIRTELLLLPEDDGQYFRPTEKLLLSLCEQLELQEFQGKRGGIFLLRKEQLEPSVLQWFSALQGKPTKKERKKTKETSDVCFPVTTPFPIEKEPPQDALSFSGGYATEEGVTLYKQHLYPSVRSYVLAGKNVGSVITASSLGYTFCGNAHEKRLTPFAGDPGSLSDGERLFLRQDGMLYDLIACAGIASFSGGIAVWEGCIKQSSYTVVCFCCAEKPFKVVHVQGSFSGELLFCLRPAMGSGAYPTGSLWKKQKSGVLLFRSGMDASFSDGIGAIYAKGATPFFSASTPYTGEADDYHDLIGWKTEHSVATFLLGGGSMEEDALVREILSLSVSVEQKAAERFARAMLPPIRVQTASRATDLLLNHFLPYQIAACRFYARASFRQSGGAYGFRDQLQDCLALIYADPQQVRAHLLRCCAHQYEEGDVQHWWHEGGMGLRTTCSDDLLWLPYVVADYVRKTGDVSLLSEQAEYLSSPPLNGENERYELPGKSILSETVLLHCLRAFDRAYRLGAHGLLRMGSCDWNDAFSAVGKKGTGESVFSSLLYVVAVRAFSTLPGLTEEQSRPLRTQADSLLQAVETHAFDRDRYLRAFCDDGEILGKQGNTECAIDILSQAFALFAGAERGRCEKALNTAEKALYDPAHRLLPLFWPPFDRGSTPVGYVRGYPPGMRENGGQYTHAAIWGALAFLRVGKTDTALELLTGCNPFLRSETDSKASIYRSEPYALCADLYTGQHVGRGGWSWYTGSAAWYYKVFLEEVLGICLTEGGSVLDVRPRIPYRVTLRYRGTLELTVGVNEKTRLDGKPVTLPLALPKGDHVLTIKLT